MILTLSYPLYRRKDPSNNQIPLGYLNAGSTIEMKDVIIGKAIDGNAIWYQAADSLYYWSGGFVRHNFLLESLDYLSLQTHDQYALASAAMDYYFEKFERTIKGFSGMAVTLKKKNGKYLDHYALVIQVIEKKEVDVPIPKYLYFHGYAIPLDVISASDTIASNLGQSISRKHLSSHGSAGFLATKIDSPGKLLVTNYHVACIDLMDHSPRKLSVNKDDSIERSEMVMPAKDSQGSALIGKVIEGRLDIFNDIALIKLSINSTLSNLLPQIGKIKGIRTVASLRQNFIPGKIEVRMFGAKSLFQLGKIESLNARQSIHYLNGDFQQVIKGLIQVTRISQAGDSGSAVVDSKGKLVGVLVAADDVFSYLLPIENVLSNFNLNPLP